MRYLAKGTRIGLREPREADLDEYLQLVADSAGFLRPWEPVPEKGTPPEERFLGLLRQNAGEDHLKTLVCLLSDGRIIDTASRPTSCRTTRRRSLRCGAPDSGRRATPPAT